MVCHIQYEDVVLNRLYMFQISLSHYDQDNVECVIGS